ncbi:3-oxoacyl-[acyl-carrier-protein] synthase III C-terminal domain-containing protein [Pseudogemmobacter hezensis]|uniref:3-oxoacyl-[acyl-carrier-protein] synthase III C-terminal domain-containing protein n=1 Tax=Pseudogemmobacter hezensis TaxID=2737662 RepID=UPI001555658D|nr:3-oxoacyl-[acyl-carrier-protein] synthase III C-terminal domain-containing protein [Pseudogemmobacter hezensis]
MRILGSGAYLPREVLTSAEIDRRLGWPQGQTEARYGLRSRHIASEDETSSMMAAMAARDALAAAGVKPAELDLIIGACGVMEQAIPSTATLVQARLGLGKSGIPSYDVNATCLSFVQALDLAAMQIAAGRARRVLVFSADISSVGLNWDEPDTAAIFGDGAAAVVLGADHGEGVLAHRFETYSEGHDACVLAGGGTRYGGLRDAALLNRTNTFRMDGQTAFRISARYLPRFLKGLLGDAGVKFDDLACIVPHQASGPALDHGLARLGVPVEKVVRIFDRVGNQIATSIPSALHHAITSGRLKRGDLTMLVGTSAGLSLGGLVVRF